MSLIVIASNVTAEGLERADGTADYEVEVSVNRVRFLWRGRIEGHKRAGGAGELLRRIAERVDMPNKQE